MASSIEDFFNGCRRQKRQPQYAGHIGFSDDIRRHCRKPASEFAGEETGRCRLGTATLPFTGKSRANASNLLAKVAGRLSFDGDLTGTADDRAALYGAFLELAFTLQDENREQMLTLWRRKGAQAFRTEMEARGQQVYDGSFTRDNGHDGVSDGANDLERCGAQRAAAVMPGLRCAHTLSPHLS